MTDVRIYIPTLGRVDNQVTWNWMSSYWKDRTWLVAPPSEAGALARKGYPALACPAKGISATRGWIIDQHEGDKLFMMDDDMMFAKRRLDEPTKLRPLADTDQFDEMMAEMLVALAVAPMVGLANRSGANRNTDRWILNPRIYDLYGMDVGVLRRHGIRMDHLEFMEDFDTALQLAALGYPRVMVNRFTKDNKGGANAPGGCSTYRDSVGQAMAAHALHDRHPEFVTVTERAASWGGGMGTRVDVRVAWKKAYEAGVATRTGLLGLPAVDLSGLPEDDWQVI